MQVAKANKNLLGKKGRIRASNKVLFQYMVCISNTKVLQKQKTPKHVPFSPYTVPKPNQTIPNKSETNL